MHYGLHLGGGAALREVDGARKIGETAEELGYNGIVTGDHITIPKKIGATYPYVDAAQAPSRENICAAARPMPEPAPVTSATLPFASFVKPAILCSP